LILLSEMADGTAALHSFVNVRSWPPRCDPIATSGFAIRSKFGVCEAGTCRWATRASRAIGDFPHRGQALTNKTRCYGQAMAYFRSHHTGANPSSCTHFGQTPAEGALRCRDNIPDRRGKHCHFSVDEIGTPSLGWRLGEALRKVARGDSCHPRFQLLPER